MSIGLQVVILGNLLFSYRSAVSGGQFSGVIQWIEGRCKAGFWSLVHGSWFIVHGFWFLVSGFWLRPETHRAPCHPHVDKRKTKRFQHCCPYQKQNQRVHPDAMNYEPRTMNHEL
jgi:hypothetical protein